MSKNRAKITIAVDQKIDEELEKFNCNKSKLIKKPANYWSKKNCAAEALKYRSRSEFWGKCKSNSSAFK